MLWSLKRGGNVNGETMSGERLTRERWLSAALEVVARKGGAKLRVRDLVQNLGVSTGSFYWHFRSRDNFVANLVDYWGREFTSRVAEHMANVEGDARKRLLVLMEYLLEHDSAHYDVAVRAWAAQEPAVARQVRRVDRLRFRVVRSLFEEMGFSGRELEMRTSTFVVFHSMERGYLVQASKKERRRHLRARHAFFTKP
jgi:AcrR family transcriptional regulator